MNEKILCLEGLSIFSLMDMIMNRAALPNTCLLLVSASRVCIVRLKQTRLSPENINYVIATTCRQLAANSPFFTFAVQDSFLPPALCIFTISGLPQAGSSFQAIPRQHRLKAH